MKCPSCEHEIEVYKNPTPTVDIIIEVDDKIVVIERKNEPFGWALPGGYVDYGESYEHAAMREALEETGLEVEELQQFRTYSNPDRDARHHTASTIFIARASGVPRAGDDAKDAKLCSKEELPRLLFDHQEIISDYYTFKETGVLRR